MSDIRSPTVNLTRRQALRGMAGVTGAAAVGVGANSAGLEPVQEAEAIGPGVIVAGAAVGVGASVAAGWLLREYEVIGSDDPPEGLTPDALKQQIYQSVRKRQSYNNSKFLDNGNMVDNIHHSAYADGKIAAIEALNEQKSQSEVETAATEKVNSYETTVKKNFLKAWNEACRELYNIEGKLQSHSDLSPGDVLRAQGNGGTQMGNVGEGTRTYDMPDGTTFEVEFPHFNGSSEYNRAKWNPIDLNYTDSTNDEVHSVALDSSAFSDLDSNLVYLHHDEWNNIYSKIETQFNDVRDGLLLWIDEVYGQVQAGELDTEELLTPRELAEMTSDDEDFAQAKADLMALNIPTNLEREAEINFPEIDATVYGSLAVTGERSLSVGTIDPSAEDEDFYLTYDVSQGSGEWDAYAEGVDGGTVTFTQEPFEQTLYQITTTAGETVEVTADDFETVDGADEWTVDLSSDLETQITEIDSIDYYAQTEETTYETIQLTESFEIVEFTDSEGNTHDSADYSAQSEPQSDDNYITEEEWAEMEQNQQELIDKYEDSQSGGGLLPDFGGGGGIGIIALAAGAVGVYLLGNDD